MGLMARVAKALPGGGLDTPRIAALDLTETRLSRPVAYTAASGASRLLQDFDRANEQGFSGSALAYRCVQAIATNAAALDLVVERRGRDSDPVPVPNHPVAILWNRQPNPLVSARVFKEVLWSLLELRGEVFVYLDRGDTGVGEVQAMYPVFDPVEVVVSREVAGSLVGFRVKTPGGMVPLLPSEVLWLRYPHPLAAWGAMAPFQAAQFALDLDGWAKAWQQGELRNGARPEGVVYLGDVDPDTHDAIVADFQARHVGPRNANRHLFLSGTERGAYDRIGLTAQEVAYRETREMNAEEVFFAFGMPRDYLIGGTTYENRTAARQTLWSDTIVPKLEVVAGEIDRQLLPDLFDTCHFDVSQVDALRENADAIHTRVVKATEFDLMLLDEARAEVGLDPLPNGLGQVTLTAYRSLYRPAPPTPGAAPALERAVRAGVTPPLESRSVAVKPADVHREYDRVEAIGLRAVKRLAAKQERVVLKAAERRARLDLDSRHYLLRQTVDSIFDADYWREVTEEDLGDTLVAAAYDAGAALHAAGLGIGLDVFDPQVIAAMRDRARVLADQVTSTTRAALDLALLDPGVEAGESVPKLRDRLRAVFHDLETYRAEAIARTETVGGFSQAGHLAATASGVVTEKVWMAAGDNRVRDSHVAMDGVRVPLDQRFPNGCLFPADPGASPEETVNCRCVMIYEVED